MKKPHLEPTASADRQLLLVRHGRSAHVQRGWLDADGFRAWRIAYEAAGIRAAESPPGELVAAAASASLVVSSDVRRALESAHLLAPGRISTSALLRELELPARGLVNIRMPLLGWALAVGTRNAIHTIRSTFPSQPDRDRIVAAAAWLEDLFDGNTRVVAVTHATFRKLLARQLVLRGWRRLDRKSPLHCWSAWRLAPPVRGQAQNG